MLVQKIPKRDEGVPVFALVILEGYPSVICTEIGIIRINKRELLILQMDDPVKFLFTDSTALSLLWQLDTSDLDLCLAFGDVPRYDCCQGFFAKRTGRPGPGNWLPRTPGCHSTHYRRVCQSGTRNISLKSPCRWCIRKKSTNQLSESCVPMLLYAMLPWILAQGGMPVLPVFQMFQ